MPGAGKDEAEQVGRCPENLCIRRIKDSRALLGALVCQVSLLDSACQGFTVSDEAQTPEPSCWHSTVIYRSCWQGLVKGVCLLPGLTFHGDSPLLRPLPLFPGLFWGDWHVAPLVCLSFLEVYIVLACLPLPDHQRETLKGKFL